MDQIILKKDRERSIRNRHPWIFSGALAKPPKGIADGAVVQVVNSQGQVLGHGHYQAEKTIVCRVFDFTPGPIEIDKDFWRRRFLQALCYRQSIGLFNPKNNSGRLFYSEGDGLAGLICDLFGDTAVLQVRADGMKKLLPEITQFLKTEVGAAHIFEKTEDGAGQWLLGGKEEIRFLENGLTFLAEVEGGQKTGYFMDQRDNRQLLGQFAAGKSVLDCFCYSGGFSTYALTNGAQDVTSVDISSDAIELTKKNVAANGAGNHNPVVADCFEYLRALEPDRFNVIVLDPPAFSKSAATVDRAARGYKDINLLAMKKIQRGGFLFTFSCSQHISRDLFRKIVFGAALDSGRTVRIVHQLSQAADHPVSIYHPEGEYLKGLVLQVE